MAAAAREHLKKQGVVFDDEVSESDGDGADMASETEEPTKANALEPFCPETATARIIFP